MQQWMTPRRPTTRHLALCHSCCSCCSCRSCRACRCPSLRPYRCGDLYGDKAVDTFNACAVSDEKCVPQRADEGLFPEPADCALDKNFDMAGFTGRWYITAGLNPLFDTFDCQVGTGGLVVPHDNGSMSTQGSCVMPNPVVSFTMLAVANAAADRPQTQSGSHTMHACEHI